jgi:hypothetical protein
MYKSEHGCFPDPSTCSNGSCSCLGSTGYDGGKNILVIENNKSMFVAIEKIFEKFLGMTSDSVYASDDGGEYAACVGGYCELVEGDGVDECSSSYDCHHYECNCEMEECEEILSPGTDSCAGGDFSECASFCSDEDSDGLISVLNAQGFLSSGSMVDADPWGSAYVFAFDVGDGSCNFVYSFGPDKALNEVNSSPTSCEDYFNQGDDNADDIWALIGSN